MKKKRAVVFAYNNIGCAGIRALLATDFEIAAVFTHKDNPQENIWFDSVSELCAERGLAVFAPGNVNTPEWIGKISALKPDIIFSFDYRNILGKAVLDIAPMGALNLHGSLLPAYRGRDPINRAVASGEKETGVTLHYMTEKPDAGDVVASRVFAIDDNDTAMEVAVHAKEAASQLLREILPELLRGTAGRVKQDLTRGSCYRGLKPADRLIDWKRSAGEIRNLVRAVTKPWPGAFTYLAGDKYLIWSAAVTDCPSGAAPGQIISLSPLVVACGRGALKLETAQKQNDILYSGSALAKAQGFFCGQRFDGEYAAGADKKRILIIGANGFIGNALCERLLALKKYEIFALDICADQYGKCIGDDNFHYRLGDMSKEREWTERIISQVDIVIPLAAIATPIEYTRNPLRIFELDFEENLHIVRTCYKYGKRLIFPSTSEVYGMCADDAFDEENSPLVLGPVAKERWIYSCSKQMLDRVIWAYGKKGLRFTLIRPFNWIGPKLDSLKGAKTRNARAITQMLMHLCEGTPIKLVEGGAQKRCFTALEDGIDCLVRIIENKQDLCNGRIINIGNPNNEYSIKELAEITINAFKKNSLNKHFPPVQPLQIISGDSFYGNGYQDVERRRPNIDNAKKYCGWEPKIGMNEAVQRTVDYFMQQAVRLGL